MIGNKPFWIVSLALLLVSGLVSLYHLAYFQKIYPRILVGNFEVSNLSLQEAEKYLAQNLPKPPKKINFVLGGQLFPLDLEVVELTYLPQETAEKAYLVGRSQSWLNNLKIKWLLWWKPENVPIKLSLNENRLIAQIELISGQVEQPAVEPNLSLLPAGDLELIPGKNGRQVNLNLLYEKLYHRLEVGDFSNLEIPVERIDVSVSESELVKVLETANFIKDKQLVVVVDDLKEVIKNQALIDLAGFEANDKIASLAAHLTLKIARPAQNASFQFDGQRVVEFKPALKGRSLNQVVAEAEISSAMDLLIAQDSQAQTVNLPVATTEPEIATSQVNDLGIKELLGKGESTFHHSIPSREHNVALTAQRINGVLVPPGEVFSFNQAVGDISAATGYQSAYIIKDGRTVLGDGGGVCQDSTTVFRAALDAGLEILERHPHSYRVTYYEQNSAPGVDATVYSPSVDLKFKNDTPAHILIQTTVNTNTNYLKVEIYGTSDGRVATISNHRLWNQSPPPPDLYQDDPTLPPGVVKQVDWAAWGAKAAFDWQVTRNGETLQQKTFYTNYQPWQAVYLRGI
jgi:vancomycin resistance protein YoaR